MTLRTMHATEGLQLHPGVTDNNVPFIVYPLSPLCDRCVPPQFYIPQEISQDQVALLVAEIVNAHLVHESTADRPGFIRGPLTVPHVNMVTALLTSEAIIEWFGVSKELLEAIGLLHDIGKLYVAEAILRKDDSLSDLEKKQIKKHPVYGVVLAQKEFRRIGQEVPYMILASIAAHHIKFTGTGYPKHILHKKEGYYSVIVYVDPSIARNLDCPKNRLTNKSEHFEVIHITEEQDFVIAILRLADGIEAALSPLRKNFAKVGKNVIEIVSSFANLVSIGEYSPFDSVNEKLIFVFAEMLNTILEHQSYYNLTFEEMSFIENIICRIRTQGEQVELDEKVLG